MPGYKLSGVQTTCCNRIEQRPYNIPYDFNLQEKKNTPEI